VFGGCLLRLLCSMCGLSWLFRGERPGSEAEAERLRERRRALRARIRAAIADFLRDEAAGA
jgi:hypothetical protein